jgi:hypothetical protein
VKPPVQLIYANKNVFFKKKEKALQATVVAVGSNSKGKGRESGACGSRL